jgi:hypothetical protein
MHACIHLLNYINIYNKIFMQFYILNDLCNFIRISKILHSNIDLSAFDPKYEIKCEIKYELSLLTKKMKQKK